MQGSSKDSLIGMNHSKVRFDDSNWGGGPKGNINRMNNRKDSEREMQRKNRNNGYKQKHLIDLHKES